MSTGTTKPFSEYDQQQIIKKVYNNNDTLGVDGFLVGKVGRKFVVTTVSPTIDDFVFSEGSTTLYTIRITYDDSSHTNVISGERTA